MSTVPPSAGGPTPLGPSQDPWSANRNPGASQQGAPGASPLPYSDQPTSVLPPSLRPVPGRRGPGLPAAGRVPASVESGCSAERLRPHRPAGRVRGTGLRPGRPLRAARTGVWGPRWLPCAQEEHDGDHHRRDRRRAGRRRCGIRCLLVRIPRFLRSDGRIRADRVRACQPRRSQCWRRFAQRRTDLVGRRELEWGLRLPGATGQYDPGCVRCENVGRRR